MREVKVRRDMRRMEAAPSMSIGQSVGYGRGEVMSGHYSIICRLHVPVHQNRM